MCSVGSTDSETTIIKIWIQKVLEFWKIKKMKQKNIMKKKIIK